MKIKNYLQIAYKFFNNSLSKKTLIGSLISLLISLSPLLITYNLSNSIIDNIIKKYVEVEGYDFKISCYFENSLKRLKSDLEQETKINTYEERQGFGIIEKDKKRQAILLRAIESKFLKNNKTIKVIEGSNNLNSNEIIITSLVSQKLNIKLFDEVFVLTIVKKREREAINIKKLKVSAIITSNFNEIDKNLSFISIKNKNLLSENYASDLIGIKIKDKKFNLKEKISNQIFNVEKTEDFYFNKRIQFETSRNLLIIIMILISLFTIFNITSALNMLIRENERKIAILKSLGFSDFNIKFIFLLILNPLILVSLTLGIILANIISLNLYYIINFSDYIINLILNILRQPQIKMLNSLYYIINPNLNISFKFSILVFFSYYILAIITALNSLKIVTRLKEKKLI